MANVNLHSPISSIKIAESISGPLGNPSKMPGRAYGLPAAECNVGSKLRKIPGSTCSKCYAMRGNYQFNSVLACQYKRLESISHPQWIDAMVYLIERQVSRADPFFRWHDSGDIQSYQHLSDIVTIARRLPWVRFWIPTRESAIVKEFTRLHAIPGNLRIRVSAAMVDGPAPIAAHTSTVNKTSPIVGRKCPAPAQGNDCRDCRACWGKTRNISYHVH